MSQVSPKSPLSRSFSGRLIPDSDEEVIDVDALIAEEEEDEEDESVHVQVRSQSFRIECGSSSSEDVKRRRTSIEEDDDDDFDGDDEEYEYEVAALQPREEEEKFPLLARHGKEKELLHRQVVEKFDLWRSILMSGTKSLLVCGVGSKVQLLNDFCMKSMAPLMPCVVLRGYSATSSGAELCKDAVQGVGSCLGLHLPAAGTLQERWRDMIQQLARRRQLASRSSTQRQAPFAELGPKYGVPDNRAAHQGTRQCCLVVHSIDGLPLRSADVQRLLSALASVPEVHLVASVDDVHAPNMWSREMVERFQWWWITCHTYAPYTSEVAAAAPSRQMPLEGPEDTFMRVSVVLTSMASRARSAVRHLFEWLLQNPSGPRAWFSLRDWNSLDACSTLAVVTIQAHLSTLVEQNILEQRKEQYRIPFASKPLLQRVIGDETLFAK